jgi:hypothetical protein
MDKMNKSFRTILALAIMLSQVDVRFLHAQTVTAYVPVMPITMTAPVITNLLLVTPSVFENEKLIDLSDLSFSFSKTDFVSLSGSLDKSNDRYSSSVNSIFEIRNTRRPTVYGIIRSDLASFSIAYFLRQRFSFGSDQNHVTTDKHFIETLPVVRKLRLRTGWTVNALSGSATYTYVANSDLVGTLTTLAGQTSTYTYEPNRNLRTQINNQFNSTLISQYDYAYDQLGRRTSVKNGGTAFAAAAFNRFVYNDRSELNESARYLGTDINILTSPVTGEYRSFAYDPIGNRTNITVALSLQKIG